MVSETRVLLIVGAERRELAALDAEPVANLGVRWAAETTLGDTRAVLVANGPGRESAARAVAEACRRYDVGAVVSTGYVGGLDPALTLGEVVLPSTIAADGNGVEYPVSLPIDGDRGGRPTGLLLTIDRVAQTPSEKAELHARGAAVVDMEAAAVAREAKDRGLPLYAVRVVSDVADTDFGFDFNRARRPDGTFSGWNLVAQAGVNPQRWRRLIQLKRDADLASRNLAHCLRQCRFPLS